MFCSFSCIYSGQHTHKLSLFFQRLKLSLFANHVLLSRPMSKVQRAVLSSNKAVWWFSISSEAGPLEIGYLVYIYKETSSWKCGITYGWKGCIIYLLSKTIGTYVKLFSGENVRCICKPTSSKKLVVILSLTGSFLI